MASASPEDKALLAELLMRVHTGDRLAFEEIYKRSSAKLFSVCLQVLRGKREAEEALQEVYLAVWRHAGSFDLSRGSAMTWLITLARNRAIDRLRSAGKQATHPMDLAGNVADPAPSALTLLEQGEDHRRLSECMEGLDLRDAQLLRFTFFGGDTYAQLADRMAMPLGTLKSRIRRSLVKLRDCLS